MVIAPSVVKKRLCRRAGSCWDLNFFSFALSRTKRTSNISRCLNTTDTLSSAGRNVVGRARARDHNERDGANSLFSRCVVVFLNFLSIHLVIFRLSSEPFPFSCHHHPTQESPEKTQRNVTATDSPGAGGQCHRGTKPVPFPEFPPYTRPSSWPSRSGYHYAGRTRTPP